MEGLIPVAWWHKFQARAFSLVYQRWD